MWVLDALNHSVFAQVGQMASGFQTLPLLPHGPWEMKIFPKEAISGSGDGLPGLGAVWLPGCCSEIVPAPSFITPKGQCRAQTHGACPLCPPGTVIGSSSALCSEKSGPEVKG